MTRMNGHHVLTVYHSTGLFLKIVLLSRPFSWLKKAKTI